ncbi:vacuolar protein sorting-associated protein 72 homolog [Glandiceps talaboti]
MSEDGLAVGRERRFNAGNRMSRLLDEEQDEDDDFYKTTYGGFDEESGDDEYESDEDDSEDMVDSDFSASEDDEPTSDQEEEGTKRKMRVVTKAYKEPKKASKSAAPTRKASEPKAKVKPTGTAQPVHVGGPAEPHTKEISLRKSTRQRTQEASLRQKERDERSKKLKEMQANRKQPEMRRLTQEELLAEAKVTEELNLASLRAYERLELEKKKNKLQKKAYKGPIIKYHSVTMPLIEELAETSQPSLLPEQINVVGNGEVEKPKSNKKCSRNFITFTDEDTFDKYFPKIKKKHPTRPYCPVTRLPAKYLDPITSIPYATSQAFKCIRETYVQEQETKCDKRLSELNSWLEQKKRQKLAQS